jgi:hypothetical protein
VAGLARVRELPCVGWRLSPDQVSPDDAFALDAEAE